MGRDTGGEKENLMQEQLRNEAGQTEEEFLASYQPGNYEKPSNTVDMLVFTVGQTKAPTLRQDSQKHLKLLLIKRKNHPCMHRWAIPGGFLGMKESIGEAAAREFFEETGIDNIYMEQLYTYGDVDRDPRMRVLSIAHLALIPMNSVSPKAGDDAEDVAWFTVTKEKKDELHSVIYLENEEHELHFSYEVTTEYVKNGIVSMPRERIQSIGPKGVAFDHIYMINDGIERMRNKVNYTPIAFNLLPEEFTLAELQQIYETILDKELVKQNFRKWAKKWIEETGKVREGQGHRPAALFRYRKEIAE